MRELCLLYWCASQTTCSCQTHASLLRDRTGGPGRSRNAGQALHGQYTSNSLQTNVDIVATLAPCHEPCSRQPPTNTVRERLLAVVLHNIWQLRLPTGPTPGRVCNSYLGVQYDPCSTLETQPLLCPSCLW